MVIAGILALVNASVALGLGGGGWHTTISNNVSPVKHFLRRTTPSALTSAPFRSHADSSEEIMGKLGLG